MLTGTPLSQGSTWKALRCQLQKQGFVLQEEGNSGKYPSKECLDGERGGFRLYWLIDLIDAMGKS